MSKCAAVSKFAQPAQRHSWGAIRRATVPGGGYLLVRDCMNACGDYQANFEIPASVRRQFELESSVRERRIARRK